MSIEAIQQIAETEKLAQEKKQAASAQAKQILRDAEHAGQLLLEKLHKQADAQIKSLVADAEQRASSRTETIFSENAKTCDDLCKAAERRLPEASARIVKRIVSISWPS